MIKESLWKNADVAASLRAAQAWRQAINVSQHWEIKDGKKLMDFYKSSMRGWAKHAVLLQKHAVLLQKHAVLFQKLFPKE